MWLWTFLIGSVGRWLLIGAAAAVILAGAYALGRMDCTAAANVRHLEAQVDMLTRTLERRERIARADAEQAELDREALERHDQTDREVTNEMQGDNGGCFERDDTERVRRFWP